MTFVLFPVMKNAPPSGFLSGFAPSHTVLKVKLESEMVTLLPVRQMAPPFEVDAAVTGSL